MQQRIDGPSEKRGEKRGKLTPRGAQHPRNLDPPLLACYLPAEAFIFWHLNREGDAEATCPGGNMKKTGLFVLFLATLFATLLVTGAWAQSEADGNAADAPQGTAPSTASFPTLRVMTPTYADLYCAGFISKQSLPDANFVAGGLQTPTTTKFTRGDIVYLQGRGYSAGAEYEIVRALKDVNEYEMFPGQKKLLKETGQPYEEVGRVKVLDTRSKAAIAQIEYSCDGINPGDTAI